MIYVYTDGSCLGNPGYGGAGIVVVDNYDNVVWETSYPAPGITTNNRCEMVAVLIAMRWIEKNVDLSQEKVTIFSDSNYTVNGLTKWRTNWQKRNYKDVKNPELWKQLHTQHDNIKVVEIKWVKGHSTCKWNNRADKLATMASKEASKKAQ